VAVNILDRYLSCDNIPRRMMHLVSISALYIASKFSEVQYPHIEDLVYLTEEAFTREQIVKMEYEILGSLKFSVSAPTPHHFMCFFLRDCCDKKLKLLTEYLLEYSLLSVSMYKYRPSEISVGVYFLAHTMLYKGTTWLPIFEKIISPIGSARKCATELNITLKRILGSNLKSVYNKYALEQFCGVTEIPLPNTL